MVSSWEIKANPSVLVAIIHVEHTSVAWAFGFKDLILPQGSRVIGVTGLPFDHARNQGAMTCIETGLEYLFYLDSDVIPPRDAVLRLMAHRKPIVSGMYARRSHPAGVPVMMKPVGQWLTKFPKGRLVEVDVVGAGCLLIHRSVLEAMKPQRPEAGKHWFDWRVDCKGTIAKDVPLSEDFTFCMAAKRQLGIPTFVDTSVECKHIGLMEVTHNNISPCFAAPL